MIFNFMLYKILLMLIASQVQGKLMSASASFQDLSGLVELQFSEPIPYNLKELEEKIDVSFTDLKIGLDYDWRIIEESPMKDLFQIQVNVNKAFFKKAMRIGLYDVQNFKSINGNALSIDSGVIQVEIGPYKQYLENDKVFLTILNYIMIGSLGITTILNFVFSFSIQQTITNYWGLVDNVQIFYLILFLDNQYFENVQSLFRAARYSHLYFNYDIEELNFFNLSSDQQSPAVYQEEKIRYSLFETFLIPFLIIQVIVILQIFFGFLWRKRDDFTGYSKKLHEFLFFKGVFKVFLVLFSPMFFYSLAYFQYYSQSDENIFLVIIIFLQYTAVFAFGLRILNKTSADEEEEEQVNIFQFEYFKLKYYTLYEGLVTNSRFRRNFYFYTIIRKFSFVLFIFLANNENNIQNFLCLLVQLTYLTFISLKPPFQDIQNDVITIICEVLITLVIGILSTFKFFQINGEEFYQYDTWRVFSWVISISIITILILRILMVNLEYKQIKISENNNGIFENKKFKLLKIIDPQGKQDQVFLDPPEDFEYCTEKDLIKLIQQEEKQESKNRQQIDQNINSDVSQEEKDSDSDDPSESSSYEGEEGEEEDADQSLDSIDTSQKIQAADYNSNNQPNKKQNLHKPQIETQT